MMPSSSASRCSISRSSSGMSLAATVCLAVVVREHAEHPAQRVAELAVGLGRALQDRRPEADVARIVGGGHPQAQDVGAGGLHQLLRRERVALGLRHLLLALLVEDEAVGQHHVERRPPARAAGLQQRGLEPAAMLVGAFQVHHAVVCRRRARARCRRGRGKACGSSSVKVCVEPESNHTSRMSVTCSQSAGLSTRPVEEPLLRAGLEPGVRALLGHGRADARHQLVRLGELRPTGSPRPSPCAGTR